MFEDTKAFSSFSVDDAGAAKDFYEGVLGLSVSEGAMPGIFSLRIPGGAEVMVYEKEDHTPASFTVIHLPVPDLPVDDLPVPDLPVPLPTDGLLSSLLDAVGGLLSTLLGALGGGLPVPLPAG